MDNLDYFDDLADQWISTGEKPSQTRVLSLSEHLYIELVYHLKHHKLSCGWGVLPAMDRVGHEWLAELIVRHRGW